jgi:hypothetical protein
MTFIAPALPCLALRIDHSASTVDSPACKGGNSIFMKPANLHVGAAAGAGKALAGVGGTRMRSNRLHQNKNCWL